VRRKGIQLERNQWEQILKFIKEAIRDRKTKQRLVVNTVRLVTYTSIKLYHQKLWMPMGTRRYVSTGIKFVQRSIHL
jgi:hypothetical protein